MKSSNIKIPIYIMEEHHQAFYLWYQAVEKGIMPEFDNILIHIDAHSDLEPPVVRQPFKTIIKSKENVKNYTFSELGIANFIIPAIYEKLFNGYAWVYPDFSNIKSAESPGSGPVYSKKYVRTYENKGQLYILSDCNNSVNLESIKIFDCYSGTIDSFLNRQFNIFNNRPEDKRSIVLDIDLDFFSLSQHDYRDLSIEITEDEYNRILNDPYHFMRSDGKCFLQKKSGKYYLAMNKKEGMHIKSLTQVSMTIIKKRVEKLQIFCELYSIDPCLIHICRSRISGYTPAHQCGDIEDHLIEMLTKEFDCAKPEYLSV